MTPMKQAHDSSELMRAVERQGGAALSRAPSNRPTSLQGEVNAVFERHEARKRGRRIAVDDDPFKNPPGSDLMKNAARRLGVPGM